MARLKPINDSGVCGRAWLYGRSDGTTKVMVRVKGLERWNTYEANIRSGACDGEILFPLNDVRANLFGVGRSRTIIDAPMDFVNWWVTVERLACGKVKLQ
jgi:hypothetical protein